MGDYLAGMGVKHLAERYGIHRATVFSHLRLIMDDASDGS